VIVINKTMSTLLVNRAQSAHPQSIRRSATMVQTPHIEQRPITSMSARQSDTNVLKVPAWRTLEPSISSETTNSPHRPKTAGVDTTTKAESSPEQLYSDEIESLYRCLDRDDKLIVQVDCLANYRKLVQTIDLQQTPFDQKSLCALQQRENRIIQRNACRDVRFRALLEVLEPSHAIGVKSTGSNSFNYHHVSEY
jgi:hypothetical protein